MENKNKTEEYACKKYSVKEGLDDYDENYYNSTNVNLAKAFIEGAEYRQTEIDDLKSKLQSTDATYNEVIEDYKREVEKLEDIILTYQKGSINH